jgi:putative ABC transport system permease protein
MVAQVAVATLLLIVTGLMIRTLREYRSINLGFRTDHILTLRIEAPGYKYPDAQKASGLLIQILERIVRVPGVQVAGAGSRAPTEGGRNNPTASLTIAGRPSPSDGARDWAVDLTLTPGYLEALGVPLLRGRYLEPGDRASAQPVAVVSQAMAARYWPDQDAVGKRFKQGDAASPGTWLTVVGVVGDVRNDDAGAPPVPQFYLAVSQNSARALTYVVRTAGDPAAAATAIRSAVWEVDKDQPVLNVRTMEQVVREDLAGVDLVAGLLAAFGAIALVLAVAGIYGVLSCAVSQRTHEIGVRIALGAGPAEVLRMMVGQGLRLSLIGVGIGVASGLGLGRAMSSLLYNVSPADPVTFAAVGAVLTTVAALACWIPARRATRVDPVVALRYE